MAGEEQQQRRDRDDDLDSNYSDDVVFVILILGTVDEQDAAREACNDGDDDSDISGSVVSIAESCFDAPDPGSEPAEPRLGITRQWQTGFILGGDMDLATHMDPVEESDNAPDSDPDSGADHDPDPTSDSSSPPASSPQQVDAPTEGAPEPPTLPIHWDRSPREYEIEEMPGFLYFEIQDGRRVAVFHEQTWREGFSRALRRHIMRRARRNDDDDDK